MSYYKFWFNIIGGYTDTKTYVNPFIKLRKYKLNAVKQSIVSRRSQKWNLTFHWKPCTSSMHIRTFLYLLPYNRLKIVLDRITIFIKIKLQIYFWSRLFSENAQVIALKLNLQNISDTNTFDSIPFTQSICISYTNRMSVILFFFFYIKNDPDEHPTFVYSFQKKSCFDGSWWEKNGLDSLCKNETIPIIRIGYITYILSQFGFLFAVEIQYLYISLFLCMFSEFISTI